MGEQTKAGFISIVGKPNVGKSTLLNHMTGEKLSIVSQKPQTTRTRITAIRNIENTQMIFVDTPGYFKPRNKLGTYMTDTVHQALEGVDLVILMVEARTEKPNEAELAIIKSLKENNMTALLVINKIDTVQKEKILPVIAEFSQLYAFEAIVPVSAQQGDNVDVVLEEIMKRMPEGVWLYEEDEMTDQTERQIAADIIRGKMLEELEDEVPHGVMVEVIQMKEGANGCLNIAAEIYCEKRSHKGIIIGKKGAMLKKIGSLARVSMEEFFDTKVYLELWVKIKEDWRNKASDIKKFGFK